MSWIKENAHKPITCSEFIEHKERQYKKSKGRRPTFCQSKKYANYYYKLKEKYNIFIT